MPQDLGDRLGEADLIVIGQVVGSEAFYNEFGEIYTMHRLRVDSYTSPSVGAAGITDTISFFTMGGRINEEQTIVYPSLRGIRDAEGMFLFKKYTGDRLGETDAWRPLAVHESLVGFNRETGNFTDGGDVIGGLAAVDNLILETTGRRLIERTARTYAAAPRPRMMPAVTGVSPLNVDAGIGDVITITGSGFGSATGDVFFDSPDDGPGGSFTGVPASAVLSWTDTRIRVRVVSEAGSGRLIVRTAGGLQTTSPQSVNVGFAITNLNTNAGTVITPLLIDDEADGNGGYSFAVGNTSANGGVSLAGNAPALAALTRAVTTWQQDGDYSIYLEGTTNIQTPSRDDDVNIVAFGSNRYDFDVELGTGTVGIAFSYYNACGSSEFEVTGLDILFRRPGNPNGFGGSVNYNFGPGQSGGSDFESIALHEIGHTHQLKHVADPNEVMSYRITNGATQREVSDDTRAGADVIAALSEAYDPPVINCGDDFDSVRDYLTFSAANAGALPVSWTAFTATPRGKVTVLDWRTSAEAGNDYFTVERSADGVSFQPLGTLAAAGTTAGSDYELIDRSPPTGTSYYRVRQTDVDGSFSFSEVREATHLATEDWSVFPNPVANRLTVRRTADVAEHYDVLDASGRRILSARLRAGSSDLDVSSLRPGQYFLRAGDGSVRSFVK